MRGHVSVAGRAAIVLFAGLAGVAASAGEGEASLKGKKAVFIIAPKDFRDEELEAPSALLKARGCAVTVACSSLETATGMLGAKVKPDVLLKDVKAADFDAVVFVGGAGAKAYFDDPTAHAIASEAAASRKVVAAISVAPVVLARAGLLKGKRATCWRVHRALLEGRGAKWVPQPVVRVGNIVTANGPAASGRFGETLAEALAGEGEPQKP